MALGGLEWPSLLRLRQPLTKALATLLQRPTGQSAHGGNCEDKMSFPSDLMSGHPA
jgi:hypothetical protein